MPIKALILFFILYRKKITLKKNQDIQTNYAHSFV